MIEITVNRRELDRNELLYAVGAMLYTPATKTSAADSVIEGRFGARYSLTLCLEDSISDSAVELAERQLFATLEKIFEAKIPLRNMPLLFVRPRSLEQFERLGEKLLKYSGILNGFVIPKFTLECADGYIDAAVRLNRLCDGPLFIQPIIEGGDILDLRRRCGSLYSIKEKLDKVRGLVLNIRVGGNDICSSFAVRRHADETIYEIGVVSRILADILTVFSGDYVVSGPVWEYFTGDDGFWKNGLIKETKLDILNGFIGKTVIHPSQIEVVNKCMAVRESDYNDARSILEWSDSILGVSKNSRGERMNEVKTHGNWARKIMCLAKIYGVKNDEDV